MTPALAFLNPALLWGLALGGIPILLHLLQRRRYRARRWAAMEFLRASVRRSSRRLRIEQWLLLLVRSLILILAALALTRPVWYSPRWGWLGSRAAAQVVLVLDDSYGMGWRTGARDGTREKRGRGDGDTQFEQARGRALELIRSGLTPGDSVSVVLASEPARALVRRPTFNLKEVASQVERARLSDRRADLAAAARLCLEILQAATPTPTRALIPTARLSPRPREVYLLTNGQAVAWRRPEVAAAWRQVAAAGRLHLIPTVPARGANLAVDEVRIGGPVAAGRPAQIETRLSNWGDQPARNLVVTLSADGRAITSTRLDVPPHGTAEARFEHAFAAPGVHTVMVSLPPDGLAVDNRGYASLAVRNRIRVLILNGHPDPDPRRDASFFVAAALAPEGSDPGSQSAADPADPGALTPSPSPFAVQVLAGSSFRGADLAREDVVVLADVPRLSDPERRALASFVIDGGGVLILPGLSALPAFYNGDLLARAPALLPARLGPERDSGAAAPALDLARVDHPALARFRGAADVDLTTARFERYFRLGVLDPASGARILCRFTDGSPALAERGVGLGRVVLLASPPSPGWNTLPFKPAFLPFLHGLVGYLGQGPAGSRTLRVGDPLVSVASVHHASLTTATLEAPDGRRVRLQPARASAGAGDRWSVRLDSVPRAGLYHLRWAERASGTSLAGPGEPDGDWFAVNLKTESSDARALSRREVESALHPAAVRWVDSHEALAAVVREGRQGREAWRGLLLTALALMLCESGMAQRFGRRRSA